jgi:hypothetical protein
MYLLTFTRLTIGILIVLKELWIISNRMNLYKKYNNPKKSGYILNRRASSASIIYIIYFSKGLITYL